MNQLVEQLYEKYGFIIYQRCLHILGSEHDAHDATQIVFMKFMEKYESIKDKERIVPWIFKTAKNYCFNMLRDQKKFINAVSSDDIGKSDTFEEQIGIQQLLKHLFSSFDKRVRDAVYYSYVEQLNQNEIQKLTGQSPATIRRNLKKFKDHLPYIKKRLGLV